MSSSVRNVGQVKWFNNKAGYGFITALDGNTPGGDIYVHFTKLRVVNTQYKYLVQGEYIEYILESSTTEGHAFQASDVTGIREGRLLCETRALNRPADEARPRPTKLRAYDVDDADFKTVQRRPTNARKPRLSTEVPAEPTTVPP
jgi:CspA family cold shock protein